MKGAVIYYSRYGSTEKAAKAIMEGLQEAGHDVDLIEAKQQKELGEGYEFVVVGSPTRAGKMSGPVKKFIKKNLSGEQWKDFPFAAFGSCMEDTIEKGSSSAAKDVNKALEERGLKPLADYYQNVVTGFKGPLPEDGEEKAKEFGKELGAKLSG